MLQISVLLLIKHAFDRILNEVKTYFLMKWKVKILNTSEIKQKFISKIMVDANFSQNLLTLIDVDIIDNFLNGTIPDRFVIAKVVRINSF